MALKLKLLCQVPRGFGLAFLSCFEELDKELCEPRIRAYMEEQVGFSDSVTIR